VNIDRDAFQSALGRATQMLLDARTPEGHWRGQLSSSALSTATAVGALAVVDGVAHAELIAWGGRWLCDHANADGGWGDTPESPSNLSTTLLAWAALSRVDGPAAGAARGRAGQWIVEQTDGEELTAKGVAAAVRDAYGRDQTFAVPILTFLAILDPPDCTGEFWPAVPALPFELAVLPHRLLRLFRANVVSYALPALIAVGQVRHHKRPTRSPLRWLLRTLLRRPTRHRLRRIQPDSGGYLEAAPLTGFVAISLAAMDRADDPVVNHAVRFLRETVRPDGSWPIDTDLATWVTTLAVNALTAGDGQIEEQSAATLRGWLERQQFHAPHPYTQGAPGGWAWTDRPGGVPDADDTAGAIRAVLALGTEPSRGAVSQAAEWLLDLQNRDGGWPTFCRGWGKLPFDQSCPDLTAHALRALNAAAVGQGEPMRRRIEEATRRGLAYLQKTQRPDGAWVPLWFGNQQSPTRINPVFGTARVLTGLAGLAGDMDGPTSVMTAAGLGWLLSARNADGAWGGDVALPPSIEETAVSVEALGHLQASGFCGEAIAEEIRPAVAWLIEATDGGRRFPPSPIGLYFASLWYHEELYPLVFTVAAWRCVESLV
jgi:squalene-hopene/tetraprenyl-beta-curcumene cyclase